MEPVAEFPLILPVLSAYLQAALRANGYPDARVSDTYRGDGVEVWLQRDGGAVLDVVRETARIRVNCFHDHNVGPDEPEPVDGLAQRVSTLLRVPSGPVLKATQVAGPVAIPSVKPQRYMLFDLVLHGSPAAIV